MKLSRIIELALVTHYGFELGKNQFMCHAIGELKRTGMITKHQLTDTEEAIQELLDTLNPEESYSAMVSTLSSIGLLPDSRVTTEGTKYTTELYVWWVFDLKNKGL